MDRDTFRKAIEGPTPMLVTFDLPWCGKSKRLLHAMAQLPALLAGDETWKVELARVDAGVEVALREQYQLSEFPTLMLFRHATEPVVYRGEHQPEALAYFLRRWLGRDPVLRLETKEKVQEFLSPAHTSSEVNHNAQSPCTHYSTPLDPFFSQQPTLHRRSGASLGCVHS